MNKKIQTIVDNHFAQFDLDPTDTFDATFENHDYGYNIKTITLRDALVEIICELSYYLRNEEKRFQLIRKDIATMSTDIEIANIYSEYFECYTQLPLTEEEQIEEDKKERERYRKDLEKAARRIAQNADCKIGTIAFLQLCENIVAQNEYACENYNSHERQVEEWAAHSYAGCTSEYYDNVQYTSSRLNDDLNAAYDILNWAQQETPLLWLKYQESKLAK